MTARKAKKANKAPRSPRPYHPVTGDNMLTEHVNSLILWLSNQVVAAGLLQAVSASLGPRAYAESLQSTLRLLRAKFDTFEHNLSAVSVGISDVIRAVSEVDDRRVSGSGWGSGGSKAKASNPKRSAQ